MKAAIKGYLLDLVLQSQLQRTRLFDRNIHVLCAAVQQVLVNEKARRVFVHQQQTTELHRLAGFAALVELRVWFVNAEQLVFVGDRLALQHAPPSRVAHLLR